MRRQGAKTRLLLPAACWSPWPPTTHLRPPLLAPPLQGVISWVACLLITVVAFHMLKFYNVERKWRRKLEGALDADREVRDVPGAVVLCCVCGGCGGRARRLLAAAQLAWSRRGHRMPATSAMVPATPAHPPADRRPLLPLVHHAACLLGHAARGHRERALPHWCVRLFIRSFVYSSAALQHRSCVPCAADASSLLARARGASARMPSAPWGPLTNLRFWVGMHSRVCLWHKWRPLPLSLPTGVSQGDGIKAIIIPGIVGVILGLGVGMLIFYT